MKQVVLALYSVLLTVGGSLAATYPLQIDNKSPSDIARFTVRNGSVEGSTRVPSGAVRDFKVTMPKGKCTAEIHIDFAADDFLDDDKVLDLCKFGGLQIR